jgi:hypothetical protein
MGYGSGGSPNGYEYPPWTVRNCSAHTAEAGAAQTDGVMHAHARARWTGRTLRATTTVADADCIGRLVADRLGAELPQMRSFTWTARSV